MCKRVFTVLKKDIGDFRRHDFGIQAGKKHVQGYSDCIGAYWTMGKDLEDCLYCELFAKTLLFDGKRSVRPKGKALAPNSTGITKKYLDAQIALAEERMILALGQVQEEHHLRISFVERVLYMSLGDAEGSDVNQRYNFVDIFRNFGPEFLLKPQRFTDTIPQVHLEEVSDTVAKMESSKDSSPLNSTFNQWLLLSGEEVVRKTPLVRPTSYYTTNPPYFPSVEEQLQDSRDRVSAGKHGSAGITVGSSQSSNAASVDQNSASDVGASAGGNGSPVFAAGSGASPTAITPGAASATKKGPSDQSSASNVSKKRSPIPSCASHVAASGVDTNNDSTYGSADEENGSFSSPQIKDLSETQRSLEQQYSTAKNLSRSTFRQQDKQIAARTTQKQLNVSFENPLLPISSQDDENSASKKNAAEKNSLALAKNEKAKELEKKKKLLEEQLQLLEAEMHNEKRSDEFEQNESLASGKQSAKVSADLGLAERHAANALLAMPIPQSAKNPNQASLATQQTEPLDSRKRAAKPNKVLGGKMPKTGDHPSTMDNDEIILETDE